MKGRRSVPVTGASTASRFDPSDTYLAAGNDDGTVGLWDLATHTAIGPPLTSQTKRVNAVAFTPRATRFSQALTTERSSRMT